MITAVTILGLPAHPLIVHGAVVGIPLAALAMLYYAAFPKYREIAWWPVAITVAAAYLFSILAGSTGEELQHALKHSSYIEDHAKWAGYLGAAMHVFAPASLVWLVVDRLRRTRESSGEPVADWMLKLRMVAIPVSLVAAVVALSLVGIVGHLGAKAAWHESPAASAKVRAGG
ncbi:MAG: hypothetical protein KDC46_04720 [Thermoleophilia bacterium]|nr:hypothetical protein [Thermoleophilia bacterium]